MKDWWSGADWITLSFANCAAEGAEMDNPGGGPFRLLILGVRAGMPKDELSAGRIL